MSNSSTQSQALIQQTFAILESYYGYYEWWPVSEPYQIMLGAVLVQNTNWRNAQKALDNLGENAIPAFIEQVDIAQLAQAIRPSGYYNQKAIKLKALTHWYRRYQYKIEAVQKQPLAQLRTELLAIKGVGGETADVILTYAVGKPSFVIDAYARRLFFRIGLTVPKSYEAFREVMSSSMQHSEAKYGYYHGVMVDHGQRHCRKTPDCAGCPLSALCKKVGLEL